MTLRLKINLMVSVLTLLFAAALVAQEFDDERKSVREEVVAAIGKPEHKVRERDSEGNDIEDWIYGQPPSKTVFVRFTGQRVTSVKQYPQ